MRITRTGILVILLITAAVLTSWLNRSTPSTTVVADKPAPQADFFLENFQIHQYDENGKLSYELQGQRLDHYPNNDITEINVPNIAITTELSPWHIQAQTAVIKPEIEDEMLFIGKVDVRRPNTALASALSLQTEHLLLKPAAETLYSNQLVTLTGPGSKIIASQMQADLKQGQITLLDVKGRYEP